MRARLLPGGPKWGWREPQGRLSPWARLLALYFLWDVMIVSSNDKVIIEMDPHEELRVMGNDPAFLAQLQQKLDAFLA